MMKLFGRKKTASDAAVSEAGSSASNVEMMQREIDRLQEELVWNQNCPSTTPFPLLLL